MKRIMKNSILAGVMLLAILFTSTDFLGTMQRCGMADRPYTESKG